MKNKLCISFIGAIVLCWAHVVSSQSNVTAVKDSLSKRWNYYGEEIALDVKFLNRDLNLNSIGSNLIFKKRFGEKRFISLNDKKSYRFQIGGYSDISVSEEDSLSNGSTSIVLQDINENRANIKALFGIEWQKQINKLQLYYGFDTGLDFYLNTGFLNSRYINGDFYSYTTQEEHRIGIPVFGFFGLKYFFHPRFSVGIESSMALGFFRTVSQQTTYYASTANIEYSDNLKKYHLTFEVDYVRFINAAFHF